MKKKRTNIQNYGVVKNQLETATFLKRLENTLILCVVQCGTVRAAAKI
jgi:ABC-type maltose transport system permease subunit